jgi:hypothetical protein
MLTVILQNICVSELESWYTVTSRKLAYLAEVFYVTGMMRLLSEICQGVAMMKNA